MKVDRIEFNVLSPEFVKKMAVAKITKTELYDQEGYPIEGGLMDPRLGTIDPGIRCRTCGGSIGECLGHFGYLELVKPAVHVHYTKIIFSLLKIFCKKCSRILISDKEIEGMKNKKLSIKEIVRAVKKKCPHCNAEQDKLKFVKPHTFYEDSNILNSLQVRERFERIQDEDLKIIGLKNIRPEWFILTLLPIPPVTMRPSITLETGERSEDDLTHKLVDIVRINDRLRENIELGAPDFIIEDLWELLQYHVSTYFDNELSGVPPARHRSGRILKTLSQRLKTKEGRFRSNLAGKRVNFSARTVISPDPLIDIDEVGVPVSIAKELTIPVRVNEKNLEEARKLVLNGPETWPGANYIIKPDGRRKKITEQNKEELEKELAPGYILERHIRNGDITLFNRQPSLHRMSMMAHRVKVMPYKTFRLNLAVTIPYAADFDGDEMNLHVPQTEEAQTEAEVLMAAKKHMRSPRFSGPIIGAKIDHITGLYLLTMTEKKFKREEFVQLIRAVDPEVEIPNKSTMTGKEIFSLFLPKDFSMETKSVTGEKVLIKDGKLVEGVIDKVAVGAEGGKVLDEIEAAYGPQVASKFLFNITKLGIEYLTLTGFSTSTSDLDLKPEVSEEIKKIVEKTKKEVNELIVKFKKGEIPHLVGRTPKQSLEHSIKIILRNCLNNAQKVLEDNVGVNPMTIMVKSGARGSMVYIVQMSTLVGQELIMGERMDIGYYRRVFPHFKRDDISLETKGFVSRGFKKGLTPFEFFFDAMNSRESLMDKSLKTRHSGYMERRLIGALQDLKVEYDRTVRDSSKKIIQFTFGEDSLDPSKTKKEGVDVARIAERIFG